MCGQPVVSGSDTAEILDPSEHALDGVAVAIEDRREAVFPAPVGLGRDVRRRSHGLDLLTDGIAVVALIAMQDRCYWHVLQQGIGRGAVGHVAAGQQERDGAAEAIGQGMDLGGPSAARATDRLRAFPPFPPAAQRCALTAEESISTSAGGPPACARA